MLVYSTDRYLPTKLGIITLEFNDGYIYVGRKAYDSGVLLSSKREYKDTNILEKLVKPTDKETRQSIKQLYNILPYPLKPLSYMLYLTEVEYTDFIEQIGALNIILQFSQPVYWFSTPKDKRQDFNFGQSIKQEYELDWKTFFDNSILFEDILHPKQDTEKYPIFVINATSTNSLLPTINTGISQTNTSSNIIDRNGTVTIDFDDDVEELPIIKESNEDINKVEDNSKYDISQEYADLLGE